MREKILTFIEKNSRVDLADLAVTMEPISICVNLCYTVLILL